MLPSDKNLGALISLILLGVAAVAGYLLFPRLVLYAQSTFVLLKELLSTTTERIWGTERYFLPSIHSLYTYLPILGLGVLNVFFPRNHIRFRGLSWGGWLCTFYIIYCLLSSVYSVQPRQTLTAASTLVVIWFAMYLLTARQNSLDLERAWNAFYIGLVINLVLNWLYVPLNPGYALEQFWIYYRLHGLSGHANVLGNIAAAVFVMSIIRFSRRNWYITFGFVLSAVTLVATLSRASIAAAFLVSLSYVIFHNLNLRKPARAVAVLITAIAGLALNVSQGSIIAEFFVRGEDLTQLTGRPMLWALTLQEWNRTAPWGVGYHALWPGNLNEYYQTLLETSFIPTGSHNSYLEALAETGFLGVGLLIGAVILFLIEGLFLVRQGSRMASEGLALLILILIIGVLESSFATAPARPSYLIFLQSGLFISRLRYELARSSD